MFNNSEKFSARLKALRIEHNLKQTDMASFLDCTQQHYQRIENGKVNLPTSTLLILADYFDVSIDYLVGRSEVRETQEKIENSKLTVIMPENKYTAALKKDLFAIVPAGTLWRDPADGVKGLRGRRLLFAVCLDEYGCSVEYYRLLCALRQDTSLLEGCLGAVIVTGMGELYTKDVARDLVLAANLSGCAFLGRPLVEATGSLRNFRVQAEIHGTDEASAFRLAMAELVERLLYWPPLPPVKKLAALHASVRSTSNTLALWELVKRNLPEDIEIQELCLRNNTVADCNGCAYTTCLHFGERGGCFYGGPMVDEVFPAVRECDALVMLCANYNDALAANLTAFVNRLTALFRQNRFYDKRLYGLVVSGYSGGDLLARQLISSLNMNKSFYLPPRFCLLETANEKGSLIRLPGVSERSADFARHMMEA